MLTYTLEKNFIYVYNWNISLYPKTPYITDFLCLAGYHLNSFPWDKHRFPLFYNTVAAVIGGILPIKTLVSMLSFLPRESHMYPLGKNLAVSKRKHLNKWLGQIVIHISSKNEKARDGVYRHVFSSSNI